MDITKMDSKRISSRREFLKKGAYVAPLIVTLTAVPAFASSGSGYDGGGHGGGHGGGGGHGHGHGGGGGGGYGGAGR
jgi:hypothetical protein